MTDPPPRFQDRPDDAGTFRSLRVYNYRAWAAGAVVSNIGTWMQRIAQDWLVLTQLTQQNATAVGVVMALQFGPQALLLPVTGFAADHLDLRKLLFATQAAMGALALGLGALTITGVVVPWHVFVFAFLLGCVTAFDAPARQAFVSELVSEAELPNAVALNSTSFNGARMVGPAIAGLLIAAVGSGWVFVVNGLSFGGVLVSLSLMRQEEIRPRRRGPRTWGGLSEGLRYVWARPDLRTVFAMLFFVGTFGLNMPVFISTMAVRAFHLGPGRYGLLTSAMAIGSVTGALLAARRPRPTVFHLVTGATLFGVGLALGAVTPTHTLFAATLALVGVAAQTFTTSANAAVQLGTEPALRGRVMALFLATALGTTPLGAPIVGWVTDLFGPRWGLAVGAAGGLAAALVGAVFVARRGALVAYVTPPCSDDMEETSAVASPRSHRVKGS